jgi:O-antigen ligase/tetratricopeptide (TPR) repeat protein
MAFSQQPTANRQPLMKKFSFTLFLFGLIFAPLAFGTVEQWSLVMLEVTTGAAYVIFFFTAWLNKDDLLKVPGLLPLVLLFVFMAFQLVPLPASLVKFISPGAYDVYSPVLSVSDDNGWISLSVNKRATLHEMMRIAAYSLMYILTVQLLSRPDKLRTTANLVVFLASAIAFLAIIQNVSSPDKIFWLRQAPDNSHPFGPWINPNQFTGYIELLCPLAFSLFLFYKPRVSINESLRNKIVTFFTVPGIHFHLFLGFGVVLMVLAVFVSLCRGGILSITVAGVVFLVLVKWKFPGRGRTTYLFIALCILLAISWFGWDIILSEFNQAFDSEGNLSDGRVTLWSDTFEIIKDFPVFGAGFGSFLYIYPLYKTLDGNAIFDHAHNDYLELLTDGGVIGIILAGWFVLAILLHGWKMVRRRRDRYAILVGIGCISGIIALLAHSITDFNMHNGAVAYYFFFLCGLLVASVNIRFGSYSTSSLLKVQPRTVSLFLLCSGVFLLSVTCLAQLGSYSAWFRYTAVENIYINKQLSKRYLLKIIDNMEQAVFWDPLEELYSYKLGTAKWYLDEKEEALEDYILAVLKNPLEGAFLQQLGLLVEGERGKILIEKGYQRALNKQSLALNYGEWLLWNDRLEEAKVVLRDLLSGNYRNIDIMMPLLNGYSLSRQEIAEILPPTVESWAAYGHYCEVNDKLSDAEYFFDTASEYLSDAADPKPGWFSNIIGFYKRQGMEDKGLALLRQAVEKIPDSPHFHILLGDYYKSQGIIYRAKEEFERALVLDPANDRARSRLRKLGFADSY